MISQAFRIWTEFTTVAARMVRRNQVPTLDVFFNIVLLSAYIVAPSTLPALLISGHQAYNLLAIA